MSNVIFLLFYKNWGVEIIFISGGKFKASVLVPEQPRGLPRGGALLLTWLYGIKACYIHHKEKVGSGET